MARRFLHRLPLTNVRKQTIMQKSDFGYFFTKGVRNEHRENAAGCL